MFRWNKTLICIKHWRWASPDLSHTSHQDSHSQSVHQSRLQPPHILHVLDDRHTTDEHKESSPHQLAQARLKHPLKLVGMSGRRRLRLRGHERRPNLSHLHLHLLVHHCVSAEVWVVRAEDVTLSVRALKGVPANIFMPANHMDFGVWR